MGSHENVLAQTVCMCGKGKFNVSFRVADKVKSGEHVWEIQCPHCRELYKIEKRGQLIGVLKKEDAMVWEKELKVKGPEESKKLFHKPKFIKVLHEINDVK